jgi:predicted alpha/beta hydrolase family esterase
MKRIFIVHGWAGSPNGDWIAWAKQAFEQKGFQAVAPEMPDTLRPSIDAWVSHLRQVVGVPDSDTYFVGHSIGCQTILRYLETVHTKVGGAVFVAGWFGLENLENAEVEEIAKPWLITPINLEKVRAVLPKSVLLISSNDDYGAFEENVQKFTELGSKIVLLQGAGHVTFGDGFAELPQLVEAFESAFE